MQELSRKSASVLGLLVALVSCSVLDDALNDYGNAICASEGTECHAAPSAGPPAPAGEGAPAGCNACDDGAGGLLQSAGEHCGVDADCCAGLTCVGAQASTMGTCQGTPQCPQGQAPNWQGLDTATLRKIAVANNINGCANQTGITQSRTIGVAFEAWVLKTMNQLPRWTMPIMSQARQKQNNGLPASVIPEYVEDQTGTKVSIPGMSVTTSYFRQSEFFEVKAVTGAITLGTSQWQIFGLLDVATSFPIVPSAAHPPPAVFFTTTSNTTISPKVVTQANTWSVAVWQQIVEYDANSANPDNPDLNIGAEQCLNPALYQGWTSYWLAPGPWPHHPLTWATVQDQASVVVPNDPDPAEVN